MSRLWWQTPVWLSSNTYKLDLIKFRYWACYLKNHKHKLITSPLVSLCVCVSVWVYSGYIIHYNGIWGTCAPGRRNMHHQGAICTMVHKGDYVFWKLQGTLMIFCFGGWLKTHKEHTSAWVICRLSPYVCVSTAVSVRKSMGQEYWQGGTTRESRQCSGIFINLWNCIRFEYTPHHRSHSCIPPSAVEHLLRYLIEMSSKCFFLAWWPKPFTYDLHLQTWPRYLRTLPPCKNPSLYVCLGDGWTYTQKYNDNVN